MIPHGGVRYRHHGCRCDTCRAGHAFDQQRWKVRRARADGPLRLEAKPVAAQIDQMRAAGLTIPQIALLAGLPRTTVVNVLRGRRWVRRATAQAVARAWFYQCSPIEYDSRRWPVAPLVEKINARYGSLKGMGNNTIRRSMSRVTTLKTDTAERYAEQLGWVPSEIWPAWYFGAARPDDACAV